MKKVLISQSIIDLTSRSEVRDTLDLRFADLFRSIGFLIVPLPNNLGDNLSSYIDFIQPNSVLLSGGNDIGIYPQRDKTERYIISHCIKRTIPLLGICRGMQMIGTYFGAELISCAHHCATSHQLHGLFTHTVNSYHDFALKSVPSDFRHLSQKTADRSSV